MNDEFRYMAAIAECGFISQAARELHISQPGLSQRLKRLETVLDAELFDRTRVPLKPTPTGEVYLHQLEGVPFILPSCGQYFDPLIGRLVDVSGVRLEIVVRDCSAELALSLVEEGLGVSVVPSTWITCVHELEAYDLADVQAGNVLRYIRPVSHEPSEEEAVFLDIVRSWLPRSITP